jgi:2-polyprenyl-3-methyl-5-hydroxy-6-metoxy-1,4-benzoquinol methylase
MSTTTEHAATAITPSSSSHREQIERGERFAFGENWRRYLELLDERRIGQAVASLRTMLDADTLRGRSFLDIGSGSGIFSLAARMLGARVTSFDYDPAAVGCTTELRRRYFEHDGQWQVLGGSALDREFLHGLGRFDVVYSWGVLHHTGDMWAALANVDGNVAPGGRLFISLYNDQGAASRRWTAVKRIYNRLPPFSRLSFAVLVCAPLELRKFLASLARGRPQAYFAGIRHYGERGMSWWRDQIDWIGGYPFEVSRPEQIFDFYRSRGYTLLRLKTCGGGHGCNEYVFQRGG